MNRSSALVRVATMSLFALGTLCLHAKQPKQVQQKMNNQQHQVIEQQDSTVIYQNIPSCQNPQGGPRVITQKDLPFTVESSGEYVLGQNLTFREEGAAITIAYVHNVKIKFNNNSIKLIHANAMGINIHDSTEITIENDAIKNSCESSQDATGTSIRVANSRKVILNNLFLVNNGYGVLIENSQDVYVQGSHFFKANITGALVRGSTNVTFDNTVFSDNAIGLVFASAPRANQDCQVLDCAFPNSTGLTNLLAQQINGLTIDGSSFSSTGGTFGVTTNLAQFGDAEDEEVSNDVVIQNSTFINRSARNHSLEGLFLMHGTGFLIDSIIIDIDNTDESAADNFAALHLGTSTQGVTFSNGVVRNSMIQGSPQLGIFSEPGSSNIVVENSLITGALHNGVLLSAITSSVLKENTVSNNNNSGIFLSGASSSNALIGNLVTANTIGIQLASQTSFNTAQGNSVFGNTSSGFYDQGTGNQLWGNTAFNNNNQNYITPVANPTVVNTAGKATLAGENLKV